MTCPVPFFVWFHHRSGSSHLCSLLDSHPEVASWGEFFYRGEAAATGDLFTRSRRTTEAEFLDHFYAYQWDPTGANLCVDDPVPPLMHAVGFKLKYQQAAAHPSVLSCLRRKRSVKAIHLVRTNLLAALVSAEMIPRLLSQFSRPNIVSEASLKQLERSVRLNPETVCSELEDLETRISHGREIINGFETLEVTYEDLITNQDFTCAKILDFLEVDPTRSLESRYLKIMPHSLNESLQNLDEIAAAIQGTRFESLLDRSGVT